LLPLKSVAKMLRMRALAVCILILLKIAFPLSAQTDSLLISFSPLTREQTAVYQAFFADYRHRGGAEIINVAEVTDILQPDEGDYSGCMSDFPRSSPAKVGHRLSEDFAKQNHLRIVDPRVHKVLDPEEAISRGQSVEGAVELGFKSGFLTLSEIIFDANHKRAAFHYSFRCGGLCGHVETVVYEKRHGIWKASERSCGFGIS